MKNLGAASVKTFTEQCWQWAWLTLPSLPCDTGTLLPPPGGDRNYRHRDTAHKGDSWKVGRPRSSVHRGACNVTTSLGESRSYMGLQGGPQVAQGMLEPLHRTALQWAETIRIVLIATEKKKKKDNKIWRGSSSLPRRGPFFPFSVCKVWNSQVLVRGPFLFPFYTLFHCLNSICMVITTHSCNHLFSIYSV